MDNFILFCKTFIGDLERLLVLKASVDQHNADKLPFYIVAPQAELAQISAAIQTGREDYPLHLVAEETVYRAPEGQPGGITQQLVKMNFYKAEVCNFFLIIDSDSYFLRDFHLNDFMYDDNTPYIVCHEGKDAKLINNALGSVVIYYMESIVKQFFGRQGKDYRFLTTPIMFSTKVLQSLAEHHNLEELIKLSPCEAAWHGEYLLKSGLISFKPCEPFFKAIVYQKAYWLYSKVLNVTAEDIAGLYLGVVMQARLTNSTIYHAHRFKPFKRVCRWLFCWEKDKQYRHLTILGVHFKSVRRQKVKIEEVTTEVSATIEKFVHPNVLKNRFDLITDSTLNKSGGGG